VFGARPLRRVIQNMLEDQISDAILRGEFRSGDTIEIDAKDERLLLLAQGEVRELLPAGESAR
jgi:ATP-dependent Clp protease ATP-binding subunit ClpA